mgnify:FL=1
MERHRLSSAIVMSIAIIVLGSMLPVAVKDFRAFDRTVTVKGLCEREVEADKVIWPINYRVASNDLSDLTAKMESNRKTIVQFLKDGGIDESEITFSAPKISDKYSQEYVGTDNRRFRYISQNVITVSTEKVSKVQPLTTRVQELLKAGVIVSSENCWDDNIQYLFEGLNEIKPDMIHEATANARVAAEQFATDSDSKIGKIKTASQGTFSIEDRDATTPQIKRVRVVTSLTYYLVK